MIIRKFVLLCLACILSQSVFAAPWSVSKPIVIDQVTPEFALKQYKTLLISAPGIEPKYRGEIERRTAESLIKASNFGIRAISYSELFPMESKKKIKDIEKIIKKKNIDGIMVITLKEGSSKRKKKKESTDSSKKMKNDASTSKTKDHLSIADIGFKKDAHYDAIAINKRDRKKRKIHAQTFLYDAKSKKSAWHADIKIKIIRSRSTGLHVAGYLAKHISKSLLTRNMLARGGESN